MKFNDKRLRCFLGRYLTLPITNENIKYCLPKNYSFLKKLENSPIDLVMGSCFVIVILKVYQSKVL